MVFKNACRKAFQFTVGTLLHFVELSLFEKKKKKLSFLENYSVILKAVPLKLQVLYF